MPTVRASGVGRGSGGVISGDFSILGQGIGQPEHLEVGHDGSNRPQTLVLETFLSFGKV